MSAKANGGTNFCPLEDDWEHCKFRTLSAEGKINEMHTSLIENVNHTKRVADALERLENKLVDAATGRSHVPLPAVILMITMLGAVLIILLIAQTSKSFKMNASGFAIEDFQPKR